MTGRWGIAAVCAGVLAAGLAMAQDSNDLKAHVEAIKKNLADSKQLLKSYEWVETTIVSMKGEEKSRTQKRCFYGADGKLQKEPIGAPPAEAKKKGGLRGKVVEKKKSEIATTMGEAKALIRSYVPPDPAKLQSSFASGKASVTILEPGKRVRVDFKDYQKPGDVLGVELDLAQNRLTGLNVASYLKKPDEAVTLNAVLGTLADGASYPSQITLDVKSADIKTVIENSGYKKTGT